MNWFLDALKNKYATFTGRARRKEFWMFFLVWFVGYLILSIIDSFIGMQILSGIFYLATIVPYLAVSIRRMHDVGKSGWFILIPIYNIVLLATEGQKGDNQYGADPKAGEMEA